MRTDRYTDGHMDACTNSQKGILISHHVYLRQTNMCSPFNSFDTSLEGFSHIQVEIYSFCFTGITCSWLWKQTYHKIQLLWCILYTKCQGHVGSSDKSKWLEVHHLAVIFMRETNVSGFHLLPLVSDSHLLESMKNLLSTKRAVFVSK